MLDQTGVYNKPIESQTTQEPCPCCGYVPQVTSSNTVRFDYWKGIVYNQKTTVKITPSEADVLKLLMDSWPEVVSRHALLLGLYGGNYKEKVGKRTRVVVSLSKLRLKIRPLGLYIENFPSRGWWLVKKN